MNIGFIGLGNVGSKLSGSLIRNGHDVTVLDLNPALVAEKVATGAKPVESPVQLMRDCDAVITCLPSPAASNAVMQEMLPEVCEGKIWMEMSTTDQAEAVRLGNLVIEAGGAAADCRVSGGCHRADTGNISIFAGCDRVTFERILPLPLVYHWLGRVGHERHDVIAFSQNDSVVSVAFLIAPRMDSDSIIETAF